MEHHKEFRSRLMQGQLIFDKSAKAVQLGKRSSFQQIVLEKLDVHIETN